jgi:hypothetical protein
MRWPISFLTVSETLLKGVQHESRSTTTEAGATRADACCPCGQAGNRPDDAGQQAGISDACHRPGDQAGNADDTAEAGSLTLDWVWFSPDQAVMK